MNEMLFCSIMALYCLFVTILMILKIRASKKIYLNQHKNKKDSLKLAVKDLLNSTASSNRYFATGLLLMFFPVFSFLAFILYIILPRYIALVLCITSGIIYLMYFIRMVIDAAKSIKKEKLKTKLNLGFRGLLSLFIFLLFIFVCTCEFHT